MADENARQRIAWGALCFIVAVAGLARFHGLGTDSLWFDEAFSWQQSKDGLADLIGRTAGDNYPPLHNLLLYASIHGIGDGEWSLRLPSAILGTVNVLAVYWLGSMTVGRAAGVLAAAFLGLSGFHVWYSQEARMYTLLSCTATLLAGSSFYFVRTPTIPRAIFIGLAGLALLYSHPFGALNWLAIVTGISLFILTAPGVSKRTVSIWVASNAMAAAGFAPWALLLLRRAQLIAESGFWVPYPTPQVVYTTLYGLVGGRLVAALLAAGVILALLPVKHGPNPEQSPRAAVYVFLIWTSLPVAIAVFVSIVSTPIFLSRYLIGSLPPLVLVGSYGLMRLATDWVRGAVVASVSVAILTISYWRYATGDREDWRGLSAFLEQRLSPGDCLITPGTTMVPLSYYYRRKIECQLSPSKSNLYKSNLEQLAGGRLYLVLSHTSDGLKKQILNVLESDHWSAQRSFKFNGVLLIEFSR